jgi:O-antigen/teichoic acid export membrane protein
MLTGTAPLASIVILALRSTTLAAKFGLAIFLGRYLDLSSLGLFGLATGAVILGPSVLGLGIVTIIMRDAVVLPLEQLTDQLRHYWTLTTSVYALVLVMTIAVAASLNATWVWALVVIIMLCEHFGNDVFQLLSNLERPLLANTNAFLRGAAWILIYIPLALADPNLQSLPAVFGFWLAGSMTALLQFAWVSRKWPWRSSLMLPFNMSWVKATIKKAFKLYISDLSFVASLQLDRYVVTAFLGLQLAGIYFLYWSVANAVSTLVSTSVLQIARPQLIKAYQEGGVPAHRQLVRACLKTTAQTSVAFSLAAALAFYFLLPFLKQPAVGDYLGALGLVVAGMAMRNIADVGAMSLFTARRDHLTMLTNVAGIAGLLLCQVVLLPFAGLYGAGAAILIAFAALALWRHLLLFGTSALAAASGKHRE